jgi:hypothetical protein
MIFTDRILALSSWILALSSRILAICPKIYSCLICQIVIQEINYCSTFSMLEEQREEETSREEMEESIERWKPE